MDSGIYSFRKEGYYVVAKDEKAERTLISMNESSPSRKRSDITGLSPW